MSSCLPLLCCCAQKYGLQSQLLFGYMKGLDADGNLSYWAHVWLECEGWHYDVGLAAAAPVCQTRASDRSLPKDLVNGWDEIRKYEAHKLHFTEPPPGVSWKST